MTNASVALWSPQLNLSVVTNGRDKVPVWMVRDRHHGALRDRQHALQLPSFHVESIHNSVLRHAVDELACSKSSKSIEVSIYNFKIWMDKSATLPWGERVAHRKSPPLTFPEEKLLTNCPWTVMMKAWELPTQMNNCSGLVGIICTVLTAVSRSTATDPAIEPGLQERIQSVFICTYSRGYYFSITPWPESQQAFCGPDVPKFDGSIRRPRDNVICIIFGIKPAINKRSVPPWNECYVVRSADVSRSVRTWIPWASSRSSAHEFEPYDRRMLIESGYCLWQNWD